MHPEVQTSILILLCHCLEDYEHVLRHCQFSAFMFDTVRKAFSLVQQEGGGVEPSGLLYDEPALSLQSTQGLVPWAALKAQWSLRCEVRFQVVAPSLDDFVACWLGVLKRACRCPDLICSTSWINSCCGLMGECLNRGCKSRGFNPKKSVVAPMDLEEKKWGHY